MNWENAYNKIESWMLNNYRKYVYYVIMNLCVCNIIVESKRIVKELYCRESWREIVEFVV